MKSDSIENLAFELNSIMDKIGYLDSLLRRAPEDKIIKDKLGNSFNNEMTNYYKVKDSLQKELEIFSENERKEGRPINLSYRLLLKTLKKV